MRTTNSSSQPLNRPARWKVLLATLTLGFVSAVGWVAATPAPASAFCAGVGAPRSFGLFSSAGIHAIENALGGTCNGDTIYAGSIQDGLTDGFCAYALFRDVTVTLQQFDCVTLGSAPTFAFFDQNSPPNSSAFEAVSLTPDCIAMCTTTGTFGY